MNETKSLSTIKHQVGFRFLIRRFCITSIPLEGSLFRIFFHIIPAAPTAAQSQPISPHPMGPKKKPLPRALFDAIPPSPRPSVPEAVQGISRKKMQNRWRRRMDHGESGHMVSVSPVCRAVIAMSSWLDYRTAGQAYASEPLQRPASLYKKGQ